MFFWRCAPKATGSCRGCKEKFSKGQLQFGIQGAGFEGPDGVEHIKNWRCFACATTQKLLMKTVIDGGENSFVPCKFGGLGRLDKVAGFDGLPAAEKKKILTKQNTLPFGLPALAKAKAKGEAKEPSKRVAAVPVEEPPEKKRKAPPPIELQHEFCDKAKAYDWPGVKSMLEAEPELVNVQPCGRWSALMQFAASEQTEAVKHLLGLGALAESAAKDGNTARTVAVGACVDLLA